MQLLAHSSKLYGEKTLRNFFTQEISCNIIHIVPMRKDNADEMNVQTYNEVDYQIITKESDLTEETYYTSQFESETGVGL